MSQKGVPQGSVLGSLFYIIYANDLVKTVKNCKIALYAYDTELYTSHKNFDVTIWNLQNNIDSLSTWCVTNGIRANTDKTKVMIFGSSCTLARLPTPELSFAGMPLQIVTSYKYLGLTLDNQLCQGNTYGLQGDDVTHLGIW